MLFNSFEFLVFFPVVVAVYFVLPRRGRWLFLLAASYYFYAAWRPEYLALIVASTLLDYWAGLRMARLESIAARRPYLVASLCGNLGLLFTFKYLDFFTRSADAALGAAGVHWQLPLFGLLLPVGISFYTFQSLSYTIDVYRGLKKPEPHLGIFALYVSFFPQLVAGPIERARSLLPQLHVSYPFSAQRLADGLKLMAWGFFKKLVIADRLGIYVNAVYDDVGAHHGVPVVLATYFFAFQIYCDFSGYSDIAKGAAQVMGYDLMQNFRRPYFSKSVREFWRRWHISLSTWFWEYLYIPLGGNRVRRGRWYYNLLVVFLLSGLWHGANWTFVLWGLLHAIYVIGGSLTERPREHFWSLLLDGWRKARRGDQVPRRRASDVGSTWNGAPDEVSARTETGGLGSTPSGNAGQEAPRRETASENATRTETAGGGSPRMAHRLRRIWSVFVTFHLVLFSWVFFRAATVSQAGALLADMVPRARSDWLPVIGSFGSWDLFVSGVALAVLFAVHLVERTRDWREALMARPLWMRWLAYQALILGIVLFGVFQEIEFIYFQF